jgi:predicted TIM-barrel fold metal-dependent hydrolase
MGIVIDTHLHIFTGFVSSPDANGLVSLNYGRARDAEGRVVQVMPPSFERTSSPPEVAIGYMDLCGVDRAILTQGPYYGFQNDYVAKAVYRWPKRFWGLAMYNPFLGRRTADDLESWMVERRFVGIKVELPATTRMAPTFDLLGDVEMSAWEQRSQLNGLLMLQLDRGTAQVEQVRRIVEVFPGLRVLICHLGMAPANGRQEQVRLARLLNVYLDTTALPFAFRDVEAYPYLRAQSVLEWAVREVGAAKITRGTDYPTVLLYHTYGQNLDFVRTGCPNLSDDERHSILGGTAEAMLAGIGPA